MSLIEICLHRREVLEPSSFVTVDVYCIPHLNQIFLPASLLRQPIFDPATLSAYNFGALGAWIGYALTLGLIETGRQFYRDSHPSLTVDDPIERFQDHFRCLDDQYHNYIKHENDTLGIQYIKCLG